MLTNSPFLHQSNAPGTLLLRKRIYPRKSVAKLCVLFGCISVPSSVECALHILLRKRIYPRKSIAKLCVPFGCISVPSSVECAQHTPSSEADLFSKIRRKVVTCCLGVYPFPHQSSASCTLLRRKRIYPRKSIAKLCAPFGWFPPECAKQVFCCTTRLPQPSRAWVVLSVMDVIPPQLRR